eukprot:scaffold401_cov399-Prasinococcus_capsulatus_cf.AAC.17
MPIASRARARACAEARCGGRAARGRGAWGSWRRRRASSSPPGGDPRFRVGIRRPRVRMRLRRPRLLLRAAAPPPPELTLLCTASAEAGAAAAVRCIDRRAPLPSRTDVLRARRGRAVGAPPCSLYIQARAPSFERQKAHTAHQPPPA